jgi:hypothetical protein
MMVSLSSNHEISTFVRIGVAIMWGEPMASMEAGSANEC